MVWTDEMTSRWASALCCEIRKFLGRKRDLFAAGVVERTGALQHQGRQDQGQQGEPRADSEKLLEFRSFTFETDA